MSVPVVPVAHVHKTSCYVGCGGHGGAHQVRPSACALPAFKIAVAGGSTTLARLQPVGIHAQAHGAAGFAPLKSCFSKDAVQSFLLRRPLHLLRARNNHSLHRSEEHTSELQSHSFI